MKRKKEEEKRGENKMGKITRRKKMIKEGKRKKKKEKRTPCQEVNILSTINRHFALVKIDDSHIAKMYLKLLY